ncbi:MAG: ABC transporter ATP-binding protein [Firmicutes bacterium]|nr:ABC transporter ATP-binding protein [Bacillota bacterium]
MMLEIKNLTKYYDDVLGVENLSLSLKKGEVFGFIGPNGAGKSTTIRAVMNLINKNEGLILIDGQKFTKENIKLKEIIGYLPSEIHLYKDLTVKEMLDFHESFYQKNIHPKRNELVKLLKLDELKKIEELSLGNIKKLGIVLAFMHDPKLIILDEPTSGLDPIMQQTFYEIIKKEKENGATILYSSHVLSEIAKICDRVGIIKDGRLLKVENIEEIKKINLTNITIESSEIEKIVENLKVKVYFKENNIIKFKNELNCDKLIKELSKYKIDKLLIEEVFIEDLLLYYYK